MKVQQIQNLIDNPQAMRDELKLGELETMLKEIFPEIPLEWEFQIEEGKRRGENEAYFCLASNDITEYCGAFSQAMKRVILNEFGTSLRFSEEAGLTVWFSLHLSYHHFNGGSNGTCIADFFFENGEWLKRGFKDENAN